MIGVVARENKNNRLRAKISFTKSDAKSHTSGITKVKKLEAKRIFARFVETTAAVFCGQTSVVISTKRL
jgi:hypothetical protein